MRRPARQLGHTPRVPLLAALALCAACGSPNADTADAPANAPPASLDFAEAQPLDAAVPAANVAPMLAAAPDGARAYAWVAADSGTSVGTLRVHVAGATHALRDPAGPAVVDPETPPKLAYAPDGALYALYVITRREGKQIWSDTRLRLARSADGGRTWGAPSEVDAAGGARYRNDHALHVAPNGAVYVGWLAGTAGGDDTVNTWVSRSADGGRTWSAAALVDPEKSCECCRVAIATDTVGAAYVAWRKQLPGGVRDIVVARSTDGGATWGAPTRVHADGWEVGGCPDAGPSLIADRAGRLHVAWWTGRPGRAGVQYARSDDGARSFGAPVALKVADASRASHVQLAVTPGGDSVYAAWDDGTLRTPRVAVRASTDGGVTFDSLRYLSAAGVAASFPAVVLGPRDLTVLWRERDAATGDTATGAKPAAAAPRPMRVVARTAALR